MATRRRGRPPGRPRTAVHTLRLFPDEKRRLAAAAKKAGLSLADYLRRELGCEIDGPREASRVTEET